MTHNPTDSVSQENISTSIDRPSTNGAHAVGDTPATSSAYAVGDTPAIGSDSPSIDSSSRNSTPATSDVESGQISASKGTSHEVAKKTIKEKTKKTVKKLFGTDGVRGVANTEITPELAFVLGQLAAELLGKRLVIGRDTRRSGVMIESLLSAGIMSRGGSALCCGVIPTPAVAYLVRDLEADGGIVISASHNPPEYNGIKFFSAKGTKLSDELETAFETRAFELMNHTLAGHTSQFEDVPTGEYLGTIIKLKDAKDKYINFAMNTSEPLDGLTIVVDAGHGASHYTTTEALRRLGATVVSINTDYSGLDINVNCGSTYLTPLKESVLMYKADIGIAHDGDADRVLAVDDLGREVDGDAILAICAKDAYERGVLTHNRVVATVMSNLGFQHALEQEGISCSYTKVGDRYVVEQMKKDGAIMGGEQSGHILFTEYNSTGDGLITALQLLSVMKRKSAPLSALSRVMKKYPQVLKNVRVQNKAELENNRKIQKSITEAQAELGQDGRILVRASGTEPVVRVMVEASDAKIAQDITDRLVRTVEAELK